MKKVGIIGCGNISQVHTWVLSNMEDVKICALCDTDTAKAEKLYDKYLNKNNSSSIYSKKYTANADNIDNNEIANKVNDNKVNDNNANANDDYGNITDKKSVIFTNWQDLLDLDLDVVHICTPHYLHAPMATEFLKRGKAVFCEKPCAVSVEQFDKMKSEDEKHPGMLGFCFQNRYNETTLLTDKLIAEGRIGEITGVRAFVTWRRDNDYYEGSSWKGSLETEGGGALINQAVHTLDLMLRYLGEPQIVKGAISNHHLSMQAVEVEDTVEAWMMFEGDRRGCFYASNGYAADAPVIIDIQGERGRISLTGSEVSLYTSGNSPEHFQCDTKKGIGKDYWGCGHQACIMDFYRCLDTGERFQNDLFGVENTFTTMMKIYEESRRMGDEITYIRVGDMVII
ncbi:Predicted dehydrogenase [Butyrivibrio fibrisolvens]|uniref:Predicted dehydrogenase n=1 Tax=Butyrivibrio fibrisolvens TaxID=831 RepID=A0A1H9SHU8_BUTFI|nr:Gfo/Idh/MocA family oxidoreductase [Butyrivibrio fibrisolvens]SER84534.1 Predicted dehydrogenase [Butyrivibrio fibrisolvens]